MSNLGSQVYNLSMGNLLTFWVIDFNPVITFDTASDGLLYISAYKDGTNLITYDSNQYEYVGINGSGFTSEVNGQLPTPSIAIDKESLSASAKYQNIRAEYTNQTGQVFFDWRGARITRIRTTVQNLADTSMSETASYLVSQLNRTTRNTIELSLAVSISADKINSQSVQELAPNRCSLRYRTWNGSSFDYVPETAGGCPYGNPTTRSDWSAVPDFGLNYTTETGSSTANPEQDACPYTLSGCQARFDPDRVGLRLPFTGVYKNVTNDSGKDPGSI